MRVGVFPYDQMFRHLDPRKGSLTYLPSALDPSWFTWAPGVEEDVDLVAGVKGQLELSSFRACADSELKFADDGVRGGMNAQVYVVSTGLGHLGLPAITAPSAHRDDHVGTLAHLRTVS